MLLGWIEEAIAVAYKDLAARIAGTPPRVVDPMVEAAALVAAADEGPGDGRGGGRGNGPAADDASRREQAEAINAVRQIANLDRLGLNHAARRFQETKTGLGADPGRRRAILDRLAGAGLAEREARLVLGVAGGVAAVDGHVTAEEWSALDEIAAALGLPPTARPPARPGAD